MTTLTDHLFSRWFDLRKYPNAVVTEKTLTLPIFNMSGKMVGYHSYTPSEPKRSGFSAGDQRYFSHVSKPCASNNAELAVWGLETVNWFDRILFLTEGVFDACRLHWHGLPAVAVLSNNPTHLISWLRDLPSLKIACVQGDKAGQELAKFGDRCVWLPQGKDVGDLTDEEFTKFFGRYL